MTEPTVEVVQITEQDRATAQAACQEVEELVEKIAKETNFLESNYAKLGSLLLKVRNERYWILLGHKSFGSYLKSLRGRLGTGRTQLYQTISLADSLLPLIGEETLLEVGKSKAIELRRIVTETGKKPSEEIINKAKDPNTTIETIRELAFAEMHGEPPPSGSYFHLGGFHVTPEERDEIKRAMECAKTIDPVIPHDIPEPVQTKEVILRFSREFFGTWGGQE